MVKIILFGPPGCGKGREAKELAKYFKIKAVSVGALLRKEIKNKTKIGNKVKKYVDSGTPVPNNLVYKIVNRELKKDKRGYVLDDFPRDIKQAKNFNMKDIDYFIFINASKDIIKKRVKKRYSLEHRKDDNLETLNKRLRFYEKETKPLINLYKNKGNFIKIISYGLGEAGVRRTFKISLKRIKEIQNLK